MCDFIFHVVGSEISTSPTISVCDVKCKMHHSLHIAGFKMAAAECVSLIAQRGLVPSVCLLFFELQKVGRVCVILVIALRVIGSLDAVLDRTVHPASPCLPFRRVKESE